MKPELKIRTDFIKYLKLRRWVVKVTVGSSLMSGVTDLICTHKKYGVRMVEIKLPNMRGSKFTPAQLKDFPEFVENGCPIYIITGATDEEYAKLFKESNLYDYMPKPNNFLEGIIKEMKGV